MSLKQMAQKSLPESGHLNSCYLCGVCASGCPVSGFSNMDPRKFVRFLSMDMDARIFDSDWVWMCTTCSRCFYVCPMKIDIPSLVSLVRQNWPVGEQPEIILEYCQQATRQSSLAAKPVDETVLPVVTQRVLADIKDRNPKFDTLKVPIDKKGAEFFLNQSCETLLDDPLQMGALWKILHLARADWTYGSKAWAAENFCMFLSDPATWKELVEKKKNAVEDLGCKVLLNTEYGHEYFAVKEGLEKFEIPHRFSVKNIIEYYARWIRQGRLKVRSDWNTDLKIKFTVQDPCQLVRKSNGNFIADELRFVIEKCVGENNFVDMTPNRSNNYCCGGGGGAFHTDFMKQRLEAGKIKVDQIEDTNADVCIAPCNGCHNQISDLCDYYDTRVKTVYLWAVLAVALGIMAPVELIEQGL